MNTPVLASTSDIKQAGTTISDYLSGAAYNAASKYLGTLSTQYGKIAANKVQTADANAISLREKLGNVGNSTGGMIMLGIGALILIVLIIRR